MIYHDDMLGLFACGQGFFLVLMQEGTPFSPIRPVAPPTFMYTSPRNFAWSIV